MKMKIKIIYHPSISPNESLNDSVRLLCTKLDKDYAEQICQANELQFAIDDETSMVFYAVPHDRKTVKAYLNASRELRIPYTFINNSVSTIIPTHIACPITFLEEEVEKGQFAAAFARYCGTKIDLIRAKDYGSKASLTINKIAALLDKFNLGYESYDAEKDSFKVYKEITGKTKDGKWDMLLLSASRDYGLDDILFGPPELHAVLNSAINVMLVNPRGDLYALCD